MANGELCRKCGSDQTTHERDPEFTCDSFESEFDHAEGCPILDCNGDCAATIEAEDWKAQCVQRRLSHVWFMSGSNLLVLDINT